MKKQISITVICLSACAAVYGQDAGTRDDINKHIEVTREYVPAVESARKIDFPPTMVDTVTLKPDISYKITPTPWKTVFGTEPIAPVQISTAEYDPQQPLFVRLASGYPFQSVFDIYGTANTASDISTGVFVNHYGQWSKIENDMDGKLPSAHSLNRAGVWFDKHFNRRTLSVKVTDDFRHYRPYGAFDLEGLSMRPSDGKINYNNLGAEISYGDTFHNLSRFNFRVGISGATFTDNRSAGQNNFGAFADTGWKIGKGTLMLGVGFSHAGGTKDISEYKDMRVSVSPKYSFDTPKFHFSLGLDMLYNDYTNGNAFKMFPQASLKYQAIAGFVPYASLYGGMEDGSYKTLTYGNPYLISGIYLPNATRYGLKGGIYGSIANVVSYDLSVNADMWNDYNYYANYPVPREYTVEGGGTAQGYDPLLFIPMTNEGVSVLSIKGALDVLITKNLTLDLRMAYNTVMSRDDISLKNYYGDRSLQLRGDSSPGLGIPEFELGAGLKYNYRERFFMSAGVDVTGKREFTTLFETSDVRAINETVPVSTNLRIEAEYRINNRFAVCLMGNNLLNQRIYLFNHYPALGASVMLGVKVKF